MYDYGQSRLPLGLWQGEFNAIMLAAHRARLREMARMARINALKMKALAEQLAAFRGGERVKHA